MKDEKREASISRKEQGKRTRTVILDAAETLFAENGFSGVSMRDIAAASKTTKALIFHHFTSKNALYNEVRKRSTTRFTTMLKPLLSGIESDREYCLQAVRKEFNYYRVSPNEVRLRLWDFMQRDADKTVYMEDLDAELTRRIQSAEARGEFRSDLPESLVMIMLKSMLYGWFLLKETTLMQDGPQQDEAYLKALTELILHGISER